MFKLLAKLFIPKADTLATYAAKGIQKAVNDSQKEQIIAKYSNVAGNATQIANWITQILADGKIDDLETNEIKNKLIPLMESLMKVI